MWVLLPLLLSLPAQVSVETTHQPVHIEGTKYIWVKPQAPLRARVVAERGQQLAIDFARVGKTRGRRADLVRVQVGKRKRKFKLRAALVEEHEGRLGTQYTALPVRHYVKLKGGSNTVLITPDKKSAPSGVLVRLKVRTRNKGLAGDEPIALAPLTPPPTPATPPEPPPAPPEKAEPPQKPPQKTIIIRKKKRKKRTTGKKTSRSKTLPPPRSTPEPPPPAARTAAPEPLPARAQPPASTGPGSTSPSSPPPATTPAPQTAPPASSTPAPRPKPPPPEPPRSPPPKPPAAPAPTPPANTSPKPTPPPAPPPPAAPPVDEGTWPVSLHAGFTPGLAIKPIGGIGLVAPTFGLRLLVGGNQGWLAHLGAGVALDADVQFSTPDRRTFRTVASRLRLAFDLYAVRVRWSGLTFAAGAGIDGGLYVGQLAVDDGVSPPATSWLLGPTLRAGPLVGIGAGPGLLTLYLPVEGTWDLTGPGVTAPLVATLSLGYRLEL